MYVWVYKFQTLFLGQKYLRKSLSNNSFYNKPSHHFVHILFIFNFFVFLSIFYSLCYYNFPNFPLLPPSALHPPTLQHSLPQFMFMGCTCKFFEFSVSYTILNLSTSISCLPIMLLIPCTFPPILPFPLPTENSPCDVHFSYSVPVLVVCLGFVFIVVVVVVFRFSC